MAGGFGYVITKVNNIQEGIGLLISLHLSAIGEEDGVVIIKIDDEEED